MKTITMLYPVRAFEFSDLSDEAKEKAISERALFLLDLCNSGLLTEKEFKLHYPDVVRAIEKAEEMRTPWFTASYVIEYCRDQLMEEITVNDLLFDVSGNQLPIRYYYKDTQVDRTTLIIEGIEMPITIEGGSL